MIIAELEVPLMFSVYANPLGRTEGMYNCVQYLCIKCDQMFTAAWGRASSIGYGERGSHFHCPHCGTHYDRNIVYGKTNAPLPYKMQLTVKEYQNTVDLEVRYDAYIFADQFDIRSIRRKETFRFDVKNQRNTFTRTTPKKGSKEPEIEFEFGLPTDLSVLRESILSFFFAGCLANDKMRSHMSQLLKTLRHAVKSKIEKRLGHDVSSLHVSAGQNWGAFLLPLMNIGYRNVYPDAPNLPDFYRDNDNQIKSRLENYLLDKLPNDWSQEVAEEARAGTDTITAIIRATKLPNKALVRDELNKDIFECGRLAAAFKVCKNYDLAIRLYLGVKALMRDSYTGRHTESYFEIVIKFARKMVSVYGEDGVVRMVENGEKINITDCKRLYDLLNRENKAALTDEKPRGRDLHDWLSKKHQGQLHPNVKLEVPEHIVRRMAMQREKLSFFLPKESMELLDAGRSLHNCVASYGNAVRKGDSWVVLVADDNGKLAACLEVRKDQLVQAKLDKNRPVSDNPELNKAVMEWASIAHLKIKTKDVKVQVDAEQMPSLAVG
ncbi:PcfJ domain-containing protein [Sporomusa sp.]|uniref:PcfJ domain-containing protein n=1 Tax=Sporomusa sp. TaxID=2078658 RepID=UPI002CFCA7AB|nr:PcfJ domain-containing protein [Sporomusa sp.]HWR06160.1 PcfJ domain-containing protein [Sporomusa sp.]